VDAHEEAVQTAQAAGLFVNQVAPASNQETKLEVDLGAGLDRPQVVSGAHLVGDDAGIPGIALGLAAGRPLRARFTARPGTWTRRKLAAASIVSARPAMPPTTSRPIVTSPSSERSSAINSSIASGSFATDRSMSTVPASSIAVTQCAVLATSIPTATRM
jgi:hypothetical protein